MSQIVEYTSFKSRKISDYRKFGAKVVSSAKKISKGLKGKTIIHINSTEKGGGVAELLKSQVPIERSLGIDSHWFIVEAPEYFFEITKRIHNALQGRSGYFNRRELEFYITINHNLKNSLYDVINSLSPDIIVIHDPHPIPLIRYISDDIKAILRLHMDLSSPNNSIVRFLKQFIKSYDGVIVSSKDYTNAIKSFVEPRKIKVIAPAIDPLSLKNKPMSLSKAKRILCKFGVDASKPILSQVSRFDIWKDPLGVIKTYNLVKKEVPDIQLIMVGFMDAIDDPEAIYIFEKTKKYSYKDSNIHIFSDIEEIGGIMEEEFVSAVYTASTVVIQKSTKEGFGLTITEAMWKGKAVVAGRTSGTELQIKNNRNGILISSAEQASKAVVRLINDAGLRAKFGKAAHKSVEQKFIISRFVLDNLNFYEKMMR